MLRFFLRDTRVQATLGLLIVIPFLIPNILFLSKNINTTFDDAYMFIRYAVNFLNGYGIAWNSDGVQTYGATSLLYLFVVIVGRWLFPLAEAGTVLSITSFIFGLFFTVMVTIGCINIATSEFLRKYRFLFPVLTAVILLSSDHYRLHSISGMDTTLSILCVAFLILATVIWVKKTSLFSLSQLAIVSYACFLTRPDMLVYSILFPVLYGYFFLPKERIKKLLWFCLTMVVILFGDVLIKYWVFGDPLPLPFYTKNAGYLDGYRDAAIWNPMSYLFIFFAEMFPFMVVLFFSATMRSWRYILVFFIPIMATFAYFFSVSQIMGFWARYYYPALPFFVFGSFMILDQRLHDKHATSNVNIFMRSTFSVLVGIFLFLPAFKTTFEIVYENRFMPSPHIYKSAISRELDNSLKKLGWLTSIKAMSEIGSQLPDGTRVAMTEYGMVGAKSPQIHIIDLIGLHDPFFAHNGFHSEELFRRKPDLIWFPPPAYTKIVADIQDDPELLEEYDYYPGAFDTGLAVRRESEQYDLILDIIKTTWLKYYPNVEMEGYPYD